MQTPLAWPCCMKDGLKEGNLAANGKLLKINSQLLPKMPDISTMTKSRAQHARSKSDGAGSVEAIGSLSFLWETASWRQSNRCELCLVRWWVVGLLPEAI
jgi:hypothetical protein